MKLFLSQKASNRPIVLYLFWQDDKGVGTSTWAQQGAFAKILCSTISTSRAIGNHSTFNSLVTNTLWTPRTGRGKRDKLFKEGRNIQPSH